MVLGLVAMATTVDNLYASMKALVCIVGNNQFALKEMERTGGFQVRALVVVVHAAIFKAAVCFLWLNHLHPCSSCCLIPTK